MLAVVLWDHAAVEPEELSLQAGDMVHVLDLSDPDWWWASHGPNYGWLPANYVHLCVQPQTAPSLRHSVRANVINELVTAERDYVKLLSDLVEGYLQPMRSRPDLFSQKAIESIFGNLEELYRFQKRFLVDLELALDWDVLEDSVVGNVFIQHVKPAVVHPLSLFQFPFLCSQIENFKIYANYCNNHDRAASQMQALYKDLRYVKFFEACRLLRRMIRLPLEAFLLSPVQKICKYPLQLAELSKHTPVSRPSSKVLNDLTTQPRRTGGPPRPADGAARFGIDEGSCLFGEREQKKSGDAPVLGSVAEGSGPLDGKSGGGRP